MKLLLFAVCAAAFARADYVAVLTFAGEEPYDPSRSCTVTPARYIFGSTRMCSTVHSGPYESQRIMCINRTAYAVALFSSTDCSGVPGLISPPMQVFPDWCKPSENSIYTASTGACLTGDFMASSPASGMMSFQVALNGPDKLCPNPIGPVADASASLTVQACATNRTCSQIGSVFSVVKECVTAGEPVPPPFVPPPA